MTTKIPDHDLNHEVYINPKDHKEHVNHGMLEYSESDLELHNEAFHDQNILAFSKLKLSGLSFVSR